MYFKSSRAFVCIEDASFPYGVKDPLALGDKLQSWWYYQGFLINSLSGFYKYKYGPLFISGWVSSVSSLISCRFGILPGL